MNLRKVAHMQTSVLKSVKPIRKVYHVPDFLAWTIIEAAEKTGYNAEYIRRLVRENKIEAVKIGGILLVKVESLKEYQVKAKQASDNRFGPKGN